LAIQLQVLAFFCWFLLAACAAGCAYLWYACNGVERFRRRHALVAATQLPISVLKPLHGEDSALLDNLRSFCRQDYPVFQIVFGVADPNDAAIAVVRSLMVEFPGHDLSLVVDGTQRGANLKVANLDNMLPSARHDILVIADSDMRVSPDYLAAVTAPLVAPRQAGPETGLVTCLYRGLSKGGLWSDLASLHINHGFLPQAVAAEALGIGAGCFGATMALKRATLDAAGGFAALVNTLADDHVLGQAVRGLGAAVVLSPYLVDDIVAEPGFAALFRHELRWARTIRLVAPLGFLGTVITYPLPLALMALALGQVPAAALAMVVAALACRIVTARRLDRALRLKPVSLWLLPVRDLLSFGVFIVSFFGRRIAWRDHKFRIGPSGQLIADGQDPVLRAP
jgi:ceramide glucosyltransferase